MTTEDLLRTALTIDDELDDIRRAQGWARLEPQLRPVAAASRSRWPFAFALGAGFAAVAAIAWLVHAPAAPTSFVAPADTTLSLHVDDSTRAVLVGPAELDPVEHSATDTVVRLRRGTLLAEFEGGHGRSLHILAPGAEVEIVGTLFAVEVHGATTCVSVSHGTVKLTTAARVQLVTNGERACSDALALAPIAPATRDALVHHEATAIAATEPARPAPIVTPIVTPLSPEPAPPPPRSTPHVRSTMPAPTIDRAPAVIDAPTPAPIAAAVAPVRTPAPIVAATVPVPTPALPTPTPTPTRSPAPAPVKAPPLDADALYADAERALAARDPAAADRDLAKLVAEFPASSLLDQAYYERARIAFDRGAWSAAQRELDKLAQFSQSPLAEPGAYLGCRVAVAANDDAAMDCFTDYRARYPHSPHDREALAAIVELAFHAGGCARAKPHVAELVARYPTSSIATSWSTKCP